MDGWVDELVDAKGGDGIGKVRFRRAKLQVPASRRDSVCIKRKYNILVAFFIPFVYNFLLHIYTYVWNPRVG